jgi:hypothetical protein
MYDVISLGAHAVLAFGGMAPVVGGLFDLADLALTAVELPFGKSDRSDLALAWLSIATTAAPGPVDMAAGGGKIAVRVGKIGSKIADGIGAAGRGFDEFAEAGRGFFSPRKGPFRGGSHADLSGPKSRGDGLDSHHMPDRHADSSVRPNDGPAIQMDPSDHHATSSNGRHGAEAARYRAETARMIREGRYRDAMAREINDVRRAAGKVSGDVTKYNEAIQEMLEYAKKAGQLPARN